jgi:hypothetical protein
MNLIMLQSFFLPQVGDYLPLAALKQARLRGACSA